MKKLVNNLSDGNIQTIALIQSIVYRIKDTSDNNPSVHRDRLIELIGVWLESFKKNYRIYIKKFKTHPS